MKVKYLSNYTFPTSFILPYLSILRGEASILGFMKTTVIPDVPFLAVGMIFPKIYYRLIDRPSDFQKQTLLSPIIGTYGGEFRTMTDLIGLCEGCSLSHFDEVKSHYTNKVEECYLVNRSVILDRSMVPLVLPLLKVVYRGQGPSLHVSEKIVYINPTIFNYPKEYPILYKYIVKKVIPFYSTYNYIGNNLQYHFEFLSAEKTPLKIVMEVSDSFNLSPTSIIQPVKANTGEYIKGLIENESEILNFKWLQ